MKKEPLSSAFSRHTAVASAMLCAWLVISVFACILARQARAFELSAARLTSPEHGWTFPVAAYSPKNKIVTEHEAAPEKRNSWSIFHRDEKSTVSIYYPQMDNVFIDNELAYWADVRLRTFVAGVAALGEGKSRYGMEIDYNLSQASPRFASVVFRISTETGGTRPDLGLATFSYDLESGESLSYDDIFSKQDGLLEFFSKYAREELSQRLPRAEAELIVRGTAPTEGNFAYFALREGGLEIFFPPYQVASSGLGEQSVIIALDKLMPYGPNLKIWGRKK